MKEKRRNGRKCERWDMEKGKGGRKGKRCEKRVRKSGEMVSADDGGKKDGCAGGEYCAVQCMLDGRKLFDSVGGRWGKDGLE